MHRPTYYDDNITRDYLSLYLDGCPFRWLSVILEEYALATLPRSTSAQILDLACGVGSFCRRAAAVGYREVVGIDLSESQIRACIDDTPTNFLNILFHCVDATALGDLPEYAARFDIVNASWLYSAASSEDELFKMACSARKCVGPTGRHVGMDLNFEIRASEWWEIEEFGIALMPDKMPGVRPYNGELINGKISTDLQFLNGLSLAHTISTDVTYFDEYTYKNIFLNAGFRSVQFIHPRDWGLNDFLISKGYYEKFQKYISHNPEMIAFEASP